MGELQELISELHKLKELKELAGRRERIIINKYYGKLKKQIDLCRQEKYYKKIMEVKCNDETKQSRSVV